MIASVAVCLLRASAVVAVTRQEARKRSRDGATPSSSHVIVLVLYSMWTTLSSAANSELRVDSMSWDVICL